jgi:hypothetical protein
MKEGMMKNFNGKLRISFNHEMQTQLMKPK